jgi:hypothetical protein
MTLQSKVFSTGGVHGPGTVVTSNLNNKICSTNNITPDMYILVYHVQFYFFPAELHL